MRISLYRGFWLTYLISFSHKDATLTNLDIQSVFLRLICFSPVQDLLFKFITYVNMYLENVHAVSVLLEHNFI